MHDWVIVAGGPPPNRMHGAVEAEEPVDVLLLAREAGIKGPLELVLTPAGAFLWRLQPSPN